MDKGGFLGAYLSLFFTSLAICGKQICFEIQTDIVSKYYPGISGNIFLQTCHLITKITLWHKLHHELSLNSHNKSDTMRIAKYILPEFHQYFPNTEILV